MNTMADTMPSVPSAVPGGDKRARSPSPPTEQEKTWVREAKREISALYNKIVHKKASIRRRKVWGCGVLKGEEKKGALRSILRRR